MAIIRRLPNVEIDEARRQKPRFPVWAAPGITAAVVVASISAVAAVDPNQPGHYPPCPLLSLTGWYCPGCGTLRALHDLAHGDVLGALGMNPLLLVYLPVGVTLWFSWLVRAVRGKPKSFLAPPWLIWLQVIVIVAYGIARNVPAWAPWLAP